MTLSIEPIPPTVAVSTRPPQSIRQIVPLIDLNPKLVPVESGNYLQLVFDCPIGHTHRFRVKCTRNSSKTAPDVWLISGELPTVTLLPSVDAGKSESCKAHFSIVVGVLTNHYLPPKP